MSHQAAFQVFFERFVKPLQLLVKRRRARRQLLDMLNMSDALLRDIGLTRYDLLDAIRAKGADTSSLSEIISTRRASVQYAEIARATGTGRESYLKAA